ncbi:hypothetical protein IQ255_26775 [Pleurocapsales cyanobacterium LEGE 10410]|nr:hypothetical protein [Pleurocapsales cyanobacterium LEGE 10410]
MKIQNVVGINGYTLLIYRSLDRLYRFSIIDFSGIAFNFDSIFLTEEEANVKGRAAIEIACEFDRNTH